MKILFVNQFYWPHVAATAQQLTDLAEFMTERGHQVTVLCARAPYDSHEAGATLPPRDESRNGVRIHRLSHPSFGRSSTLNRVLDYAGFHLLCSLWTLFRGSRYDVIVSLTTPPLIGLHATIVRMLSFHCTRHVCWAMDLHPDCEFELNPASRRNPVLRILDYLNGLHFRLADATVVLGNRMRDRLLAKRVTAHRLHVIGVWSRSDEIAPIEPSRCGLRSRLGLDGKFVVMYSGNAGLIHTFDAVCGAMRRLNEDDRFRFVFAGGGRRLHEVEDYALRNSLRNFIRLPYYPRDRIGESLALADIHLVTLRENMSGVAVPCKLYGIMAAGRPTLFVGPRDSDSAEQILEAGAGIVVAPNDEDGIVRALRHLAADRDEVERLGQNSHRYFLSNHERNTACGLWADLLEGISR